MAREGLVRVTTMRQAEGRRPHMTHVWKRVAQMQGSVKQTFTTSRVRGKETRDVVQAGLTDILQGVHNPETLEPLRAAMAYADIAVVVEPTVKRFPPPEAVKNLFHYENARFYAAIPKGKLIYDGEPIFSSSFIYSLNHFIRSLVGNDSFPMPLLSVYAQLLMGLPPTDYEEVIREGTDPIVAHPHPRIYSQYAPYLLQWLNRDAYMYLLGYEMCQRLESVEVHYITVGVEKEEIQERLAKDIAQLDALTGARVADEWNRAIDDGYYKLNWNRVRWLGQLSKRLPFDNYTKIAFGRELSLWIHPEDFIRTQDRI